MDRLKYGRVLCGVRRLEDSGSQHVLRVPFLLLLLVLFLYARQRSIYRIDISGILHGKLACPLKIFPIELVPFHRGHLFVLGAETRKNGSSIGILFSSWCEAKGARELEVSKSLNRERFGATPFPSTDYQ